MLKWLLARLEKRRRLGLFEVGATCARVCLGFTDLEFYFRVYGFGVEDFRVEVSCRRV